MNNNSKEYKVVQKLDTVDDINYENITFSFDFYKNNKVFDSQKIIINNTTNGQCTINFTKKLSEEPDSFGFEILNATKI